MTQVVIRKAVRAGIYFLNTASCGTVRVAFSFFETNLQKRSDGAGNSHIIRTPKSLVWLVLIH